MNPDLPLRRRFTSGETARGVVFVLYGLSGFVSLGYQVAWFRIYVDRFGSTNLTFALVLCNFIGGLGAGALASRYIARRLATTLKTSDRLRVYGFVELLVSVSVLLTFLAKLIPTDMWGTYLLRDGIYIQHPLYLVAKLTIATFCVFLPCFFMGATFPLLCHVFGRDGRFPSALYAWNTLGACSGVLVCQFALLPWVGHDRMLWILVALNLVLGLFFFLAAGAPRIAPAPVAVNRQAFEDRGSGVLLACAVLSGLLAGAVEGDMFKRIGFAIGSSHAVMSFISFWAILGIFAGSWAVRSIVAIRLSHIKVGFVLAVSFYVSAWWYAYPLRDWLIAVAHADVIKAIEKQAFRSTIIQFDFPTSLVQLLVYVGIFVFPTFLCISLLLPYVCNRIQADRRHLGFAYGANTLAFCLGLVGFTWLAPRVNIFYSMKLMIVLLVVGVALLLVMFQNQRLSIWKPLAALIVFGIACWVTPRGFDRGAVMPLTPAAEMPVRALMSNGAHTTYVVSRPDGDALYFDNYSMSGTALPAQIYMRLMAHFPLLLHPDPRSALLICFGVGNTAAAIAVHESIDLIDVVDLNHKVFETAPEFSATNGQVFLDPRVRFIHDDGRNFLNITDRRYDLVTSEPPPPMMAGVDRLYSKEYYEQVLDHLTPEGMMTQWLPIYQMPHEAVELVVSTFISVFPHTLMFTGINQEFILMGGRSPIQLQRLERRFMESKPVVAELRRLRITRPLSLVARVIKSDRALRAQYGGLPVISDQRNDLAYLFIDPQKRAVITYNPLEVLADIGAERLAMHDQLRDLLMHLGRLRYVARIPYESLMTVQSADAPGVALTDVDWQKIVWILDQYLWILDQYHESVRGGRSRQAIRLLKQAIHLLEEALNDSEEQPELLLALAERYVDAGRLNHAAALCRRFQEMEPDDAIGYPVMLNTLGQALVSRGQLDEAIKEFREVLRINPDSIQAHNNMGIALGSQGNLDEAIHHFRQMLRLKADSAEAHSNLGVALRRKGRFDEAIHHFREVLRITPGHAGAQKNLNAALDARSGHSSPR